MSSKSSNLNLYSSDNLDEKALHVVSVDAKLSMTSPNVFEFSAPQFSLQGQTTAAHDIADLGLYLKTLSDLQSSDSTTQSAAIASNTTNIATIDAREQANHSAQATLLGTETARASAAETVNASAISAEATTARAAEAVNAAAVVTEANDRAAAVTAEATARTAADTALQSQIDALGVVDASTLAQINAMLASYQAADNSLQNLVTALDTRVTDLEAEIDALTA